MPERGPQVGKERHTADQPNQRDSRTLKLARFLGVIAGNSGNIRFESVLDSPVGVSFDWDPWIRALMPEFAVIMTADRREPVRWPVAIVVTDTGQVIPLDRKQCHPSDASLLLSGEKVSEIRMLIDALDSAVHGMVDGDRVASALKTLNQLRRICRNDL
jgi:hypothetical protein